MAITKSLGYEFFFNLAGRRVCETLRYLQKAWENSTFEWHATTSMTKEFPA